MCPPELPAFDMSGNAAPPTILPVGGVRVPTGAPTHADTILTGAERADFNVVLTLVRGIDEKLDRLEVRMRTTEMALARQEGGDVADARNAERRTSESRWRKGVAVSIALALFGTVCSVVLGLANLALNSA